MIAAIEDRNAKGLEGGLLNNGWSQALILSAIVASALACAGLGNEVASDVEVARRAVHQRCHSEFNSCRMAAGAQKAQQQACQDRLAACTSVPSME